ncbi:hypothetical protein CP972_04770 [Streptomyces prasinus]|uniref:Uncharacterized protein n=1 Tax=Streptomyces prasinus TaxID=67345 RepID=A0ABX6ARB6_9ACTN|nr:hypothetical protein CP972_04770 [Streptomyces prasinus]
MEATWGGSDTRPTRAARAVEDARNGKASAQRLADRISAVFVPAVIVSAPGTPGSGRRAGELAGRGPRPLRCPAAPLRPGRCGATWPPGAAAGVRQGCANVRG